MNETNNNFLNSLKKDLESELNDLKIEKKQEEEKLIEETKKTVQEQLLKNKLEIRQILARKLGAAEKTQEEKIKKIYYWLFGVGLVLLIIILGVFFYLRRS